VNDGSSDDTGRWCTSEKRGRLELKGYLSYDRMVLGSKISSNVMPSAYTAGGVAYIAQHGRNETGWQATCVLNWN